MSLSSTAAVAKCLERPGVPASSKLFQSPAQRTLVLTLLLTVVVLVVYNPVIHNGFLNFDDDGYITANAHVKAGLTWATVKWAFTTYNQGNWHPLTWLSHALDYRLFGLNPAGHHYVNVLLHAVNAVLLFLLLHSATGFRWRSLMVAALFALHPVNVESVAWAAERKNVLSMTFFLLALLAYDWYARKPEVRRYAVVAFVFALGLLAKPQVITFPFLLLLWDYWPLGRIGAPSFGRPGGPRRERSQIFDRMAGAGKIAASAALRSERLGDDEGPEGRRRHPDSFPKEPALALGERGDLVCALSGESALAIEAGRAVSAP